MDRLQPNPEAGVRGVIDALCRDGDRSRRPPRSALRDPRGQFWHQIGPNLLDHGSHLLLRPAFRAGKCRLPASGSRPTTASKTVRDALLIFHVMASLQAPRARGAFLLPAMTTSAQHSRVRCIAPRRVRRGPHRVLQHEEPGRQRLVEPTHIQRLPARSVCSPRLGRC